MRLRDAALLFLAAAVPAAASAQQGDTLVLSLEQAVAIGRLNNPAYRRAVNNLELNGPETRAAWANGILPRLQLDLSTGYSGNLSRRATDVFGNPVANPDAEYLNFSQTTQGLGLSWLVRGPSLLNRKAELGATNAGRFLEEDVAGEELRIALRRRFFDALEQDELLEVERTVADASRSDLETAQRLFELALKSRVDVLQAELQIQQQQLTQRQQVGRRDQARLELRTALGQIDLPPVRPAATVAPAFDPAELDDEALVRRASEASADVRRQASALRQAHVAVSQRRSAYWPTLSASLRVGRQVQASEAESLFSFGGFGDDLYSSFNVTMSLPFLSDPLGSRLGITQAEVARENQRDALREARLQSEQAARSALVALRDQWESLRIAERALAIAQETLDLAREEYRLGTRDFGLLQTSVKNEADARRGVITARYGFVDALLDLEAAVGGPVR